MSKRVSVAGLDVDTLTKPQLLEAIVGRFQNGQKTFLTTLYSEFLYAAMRSREIMAMLNKADLAVPDGIGVIWAHYFLSKPFSVEDYYLKILQAWWQVVYTGASILLNPQKLYQTFPEKIVGADLVWDLAKLAEQQNYSIYLLGWPEQETAKVKDILVRKHPKLNIVGHADTTPNNQNVIDEIKQLKPDMVLVAFGPLKQERWITSHLPNLPIKFAVGLGGTFDYLLGKKFVPPKFIRSNGLEWLYRLFTQPSRLPRIFKGTYGLILALVRYKVFMSLPLRKNGTAVVINQQNKVLVCKRASAPDRASRREVLHNDYWQFPQGGLDDHETVEVATARELKEETGITTAQIIGVAQHENFYYWENWKRPFFGPTFQNPGQYQHTVFFRFTGDDSEIRLDPRELTDYRWVSIDEAGTLIANERKPHANAVLAELKELIEKSA